MRVLIVTDALPDLPRGGQDLHVRELEVALRSRDVDLHVHALADGEPDAIGVAGAPGTRFRRSFANAEMCRRFERLLSALRPDVAHFQSLRGLHYGMPRLAHASGARVVWTHHDAFAICQRVHLRTSRAVQCGGPRGGRACGPCFGGIARLLGGALFPLRTSAMASAMGTCDALVAPSAWLAQLLTDHGVDPRLIRVLPPAVPRPERDARPPTTGARPRLVFAGDLRPEKGADLACAATNALGGAVELHVHGGSPAPPAAPDHVFERTLQMETAGSDVTLHGRYAPAELLGLLDGATALVAPSRVRESFGRTVNLALLAGVPVIAANHGALPESVIDGINGTLFEPGDVDSLRDAIERAVSSAEGMREHRGAWPTAPHLGQHVSGLLKIYGEAA